MAKITNETRAARQRNIDLAHERFQELGGKIVDGFPVIDSPVYFTEKETPYLKRPGVVMISKPDVNLQGLAGFLNGFDPQFNFPDYLNEDKMMEPGAQLAKTAGQVCYASYGPGRTRDADADGYIEDLKKQEHGSVLEHPSFSFLIYGVSRSLTHEEVRHRAGKAFSQLSQRYVAGRVLRFVERPEYQESEHLHRTFETRIDRTAAEYKETSDYIYELQRKGDSDILAAESKTDQRKKAQQTARSVLTNETETVLVDSANARAAQHTINMRSSPHAETEIRELYYREYLCYMMVESMLFADFEIANYPDGTHGAQSPYRKP